MYRADVSQPVQQTPSRQYQNVSPLLVSTRLIVTHNNTMLQSQESHQRFDIPTKKRVYFTPEQRSQLEDLYKNQQYPTRDDKSALAKSLSIDENKIQVWFQNRRARDRWAFRFWVFMKSNSSILKTTAPNTTQDSRLARIESIQLNPKHAVRFAKSIPKSSRCGSGQCCRVESICQSATWLWM